MLLSGLVYVRLWLWFVLEELARVRGHSRFHALLDGHLLVVPDRRWIATTLDAPFFSST